MPRHRTHSIPAPWPIRARMCRLMPPTKAAEEKAAYEEKLAAYEEKYAKRVEKAKEKGKDAPAHINRRNVPVPKPKRQGLPKDMTIDDVTLEKALSLLALPRDVGEHPETGKMIKAGIGRFGPFVMHDGKFASIPKDEDVMTIGMNRAVDLIAKKMERDALKGTKKTASKTTAKKASQENGKQEDREEERHQRKTASKKSAKESQEGVSRSS